MNDIRKVIEQTKLRKILKRSFPKIYSNIYIDLLLKIIINDENKREDFIGLQYLLQY